MSEDLRFERNARAWLELGPIDAPDRVIEAALLEIDRTTQERGHRVPWRLPTMTLLSRVAAVAVAILAIGAAAVFLIRPSGNTGVGAHPTAPPSIPTIPPTASPPTASVSPAATPTAVDASGFAVPFQMSWEVPVQWDVKTDVVDILYGGDGMNIFHVDRVGKNPCLTNDLLSKPLTTPRQFMDWLATIPRVTLGAVTSASIGGQSALERTVTVGDLAGCIDTKYLHSGIVSQYGGAGGYFMTAGETERWFAMEVHGKLVAVAIWPFGETTMGGAAVRAVSTIRFAP
jgi:hypothetical protein